MVALLKQQYGPDHNNSYIDHNAILDPVIDGVNEHSHDPLSDGRGSYIPQFGSLDPRYSGASGAPHLGPGSANWSNLSTLSGQAAIPADPYETAIDPVTGTVISRTGSIPYPIQAGHGQGMEIAKIRGQLTKITGGNWDDPIGAIVTHDTGSTNLTLGGTTNAPTGVINAAGANLVTATGVPPMVVSSSALVANLNAQFISGSELSSQPGVVPHSILRANANGLHEQSYIAANPSQNATWIGNLGTTDTVDKELNNIRAVLNQYGQTFFGNTGTWNSPISSTPNVVTTVSANGVALSGDLSINSGVGVLVSQDTGSSIRIDVVGSGPSTDAPNLTYPDFFSDTVISGNIMVDQNPNGTTNNLHISISGSPTAYINGYRILGSQYGYGPYAVLVSGTGTKTNYVWWNGGSDNTAFQITGTNTSPGLGWILFATATLNQSATLASQTTVGWTIIKKVPTLNAQPSVSGTKTITTNTNTDVTNLNTKVNNIISALAGMGFIIDNTV